MKDRIKGLLTKKKLFRFFKIALIVIFTSVVFLSLFGTVAHATGLVDDTVNADNLYSQYPLENYQLDFYVDNSWGWLPWNWLDGIGKVRTIRALLYHQFYLDYQPVSKQRHGVCRPAGV